LLQPPTPPSTPRSSHPSRGLRCQSSSCLTHNNPCPTKRVNSKARVIIEDWRIDYNNNRPHGALGRLTPTAYAKAWINQTNVA
ncbi:MAG: integrase core domain-containing protein, partial [Acidimicrobiia bacterium]